MSKGAVPVLGAAVGTTVIGSVFVFTVGDGVGGCVNPHLSKSALIHSGVCSFPDSKDATNEQWRSFWFVET